MGAPGRPAGPGTRLPGLRPASRSKGAGDGRGAVLRLGSVPSIQDPDVRKFLTESTRTGKLAYLGPSGRPLVAPIWFILEGDELVFNTGKDTAKGRYLARDPRPAITVDLEAQPYAFVQVQGNAELSEDPAELLRTATEIARRYVAGSGRAEEFGRRNGVPGELVVRVRPTKVLADFNMIG